MLDLLGQMNVLKGLTDQSLQAELTQPSGAAAPYLVLSEINRRKDMRQRYSADTARRSPQTTVAQDLAGAPPPAPAMPEPAPPTGIAAASGAPPVTPAPGIAAAVPGFADGGLIDYSALASSLENNLTMSDADRQRALYLALLQGGAAAMAGNSPNALQNIGAGISAGVNSYTDAIKTQTANSADAARELLAVGEAQRGDLAQMQLQQYREQDLQQRADQAAAGRVPAAVNDFKYWQSLSPADKQAYAEYEAATKAPNPNQLSNDQLIGAKLDAIYQDAQRAYPIKDFDTPEDAAAKQQKAQATAYERIKAAYGASYADNWAQGMGINPNDLLLSTGQGPAPAPANGAPGVTPSPGATSPAAVPYTQYFQQ